MAEFQRDHTQSSHRLGSSSELCTCGSEYRDHYNGKCPGNRHEFLATARDKNRCHICLKHKDHIDHQEKPR